MPEQPPGQWFNKTSTKVKQSLKDAHPDWSEETLEERTRETVGDIWYNKLSQEERDKITRKYESAAELAFITEKIMKDDSDLVDTKLTLHDGLDRLTSSVTTPIIQTSNGTPSVVMNVAAALKAEKPFHVPTYKFAYTAEPKPGFQGENGPIIIKALVLEEGSNINGWRVQSSEFPRVAEQYKAGRQLRTNHGKDVENVIGRSFSGSVIKGKDVFTFIGRNIDGIEPEGLYVTAEFEANPRDPQVRTNILKGYVDTGSIGLDAEAFCEECGKPITSDAGGQMQKSCTHMTAGVLLRNVEAKEYSFVAEPAYEHTRAYPSFTSAVNRCLGKECNTSLNVKASTQNPVMPEPEKTVAPVPVSVEAKADGKKAEGEGDAKYNQADMDAYAEMKLAIYKQGMADAMKLRAKDDDEEEEMDATAEGKRAEASAKPKKTDAIGRTDSSKVNVTAKETLMNRVLNPTKTALSDPSMRELFKAASQHPNAPPEIRARYKEAFN